MDQKKLNQIIIDWKTKRITPEEAMERVHRLNNLEVPKAIIKNFVELFCGYGVVTETFKKEGFNTWKTDIRKRKGVCEPDLRKNILQLTAREIPFKKVHVLWASPPCDVWSYASGDFHWNENGSPKTEKCQEHIKILKKTLELIDELNPEVWFIENPRGRLRSFPLFVRWLKKHHVVTKTLTYSSYGFPSPKPTNIFTNASDIEFKELDKFGRGAKVDFKLDNISVAQKQKVPGLFAEEILKYVRGFFQNKPRGSFL